MASNDPRLRGQEVEIRIFTDSVLEDSITAIASFEATAKFEKKEDGFLGETSNRYDHIYNGQDMKLEFQVNSAKWLNLKNRIKAQAQRKTPGTVINIVRTDFYANGETTVTTYPDCKFGPMPVSVPARGDFVKVSLDFSCTEDDEQVSTAL